MSESTINQRLKFLIDTLELKVGAFSRVLGVSETTTRNYTDRGSKPGSDYLEKIGKHFKQINLAWLITGEGEPIVQPSGASTAQTGNNFYGGNSVGINHGTNTILGGPTSAAPNADCQTKLNAAMAEVQSLRSQLDLANALVAAKEETISVFRTALRNNN